MAAAAAAAAEKLLFFSVCVLRQHCKKVILHIRSLVKHIRINCNNVTHKQKI